MDTAAPLEPRVDGAQLGARSGGGSSDATFVLEALEVYNWGAFAGRHSVGIDRAGTAIIGATGSGKTTLVDALMTLLAANPRYNLASTGGHQSDRDLMSYIRGVSGPGNNSGDNVHIARPGRTVTAIGARLSDGEHRVTLAAIFSLDGTSAALADLKRAWIFSQAPDQDLDQWLGLHHEGGIRALKLLGREVANLGVFDAKSAYLARVQGFFEVGENAFALLNRAAGLKQLDSIDEIFRELVLEDSSAFERAAEVAQEFDNLAGIHAELEIARNQQASLRPVAESWRARGAQLERLGVLRDLQFIAPLWFAGHAHRLWRERGEELDLELHRCAASLGELAAMLRVQEGQAEALRVVYLQVGGASVEQLLELIASQQRFVEERARYAADYRRLTARLNLDGELSAAALAGNQGRIPAEREMQRELWERQRQAAWELGAARENRHQEVESLRAELALVGARPGSSVPGEYQRFRAELGKHLGWAGDEESLEALPYVAELIEVRAEEARWHGAIERAVGSERLRILVPEASMGAALAWVNDRDNRLHVRLLEVRPPPKRPEFFADGFLRKLKFKPHRYADALKSLLVGLDRHCVASSDALLGTPHAMTAEGAMSGASGKFDKQDRQPLDRGWMTGFDNKVRLAELKRSLDSAVRELDGLQTQLEVAQGVAEGTQHRLTLLDQVSAVVFGDIDLPGAQRELDAFNGRLAALSAPDSDAEAARRQWEQADQALLATRREESRVSNERAVVENERGRAREEQERALRGVGAGLSDGQRALAEEHLAVGASVTVSELRESERSEAARLTEDVRRGDKKLGEIEQDLVRAMEKAKKADTGALSEVGTEIGDIPAYLSQLRKLTEEALPEKQKRFLSYLNESSDQGVTQLLSAIDNEVAMIEERIEDLNRTLRRVDFQKDAYLCLQPQRVVHESLRDLQQSQRHLRSAALKDDQGESHFRALRQMVELLRDASDRKKTLGARELLDPRYRLHFAVSVIARDTGTVIETRTGSQGGSGGEKEIIASYVLTASLSYALCPNRSTQPLFGTIVLDEAFSKSSHAVANRIVRALTEFGLHPLFVTPNKELRLLREHTRSAIIIHRKGQQATTTSLSWEMIDEHLRQRNSAQPP